MKPTRSNKFCNHLCRWKWPIHILSNHHPAQPPLYAVDKGNKPYHSLPFAGSFSSARSAPASNYYGRGQAMYNFHSLSCSSALELAHQRSFYQGSSFEKKCLSRPKHHRPRSTTSHTARGTDLRRPTAPKAAAVRAGARGLKACDRRRRGIFGAARRRPRGVVAHQLASDASYNCCHARRRVDRFNVIVQHHETKVKSNGCMKNFP